MLEIYETFSFGTPSIAFKFRKFLYLKYFIYTFTVYNTVSIIQNLIMMESRLLEEISITSDMQMTPLLCQKAKKNYRASIKIKEESEKVGIQKTKIMASSLITSWQIDGETMETVRDFILGASKITADGDCSLEIKRHLLLGRKVMEKLDY